MLKESIPHIDDKTVHLIIKKTERIPIYLDTAIKTYKNACLTNEFIDINTFFLYKNKKDIIKKFFNHLSPEHQRFLLTLSFLQLFDQDIYSFIIQNLCPSSTIEEYNDFKLLSIISNVENDSNFYKVHDVLNANVIEIMDLDSRLFLFRSYLDHIVSKTVLYATDTQKIFLYEHIINMIIKNKFELNENETELLLDLFFSLKQTLHTILPSGISGIDEYESLSDIKYFTKAIANEREDTLIRLEYLNHINFDNNKLGKHQKSLNIIYGYLTQWTGNDKPLTEYLSYAYPLLNDSEIREWYYAQTVIFWADHLTITGNFTEAHTVLQSFGEKLIEFPEQENSIFQTKRHMGHIFRFNMFLDDANNEYLSVRNEYGKFRNMYQKIYILTNICETNCFLNPEKVIHHCYEGLRLGKNLKDLKSMAKIYYSMGISYIHMKKYKRAKKYIRKSMALNIIDGYELGNISPMLALIYLRFATGKPLRESALKQFLARVNVYGFQILPVAIIQNDKVRINTIKKQNKWLDFNTTMKVYKSFFTNIQSYQYYGNSVPKE